MSSRMPFLISFLLILFSPIAAQGLSSPAAPLFPPPPRGSCSCKRPGECGGGVARVRCLVQWILCGCSSEVCSLSQPCKAGFSCEPGWNRCFHSPRQAAEPCADSQSCANGLTCVAGKCSDPKPQFLITPQDPPLPLTNALAAPAVTLSSKILSQEWEICQTDGDCANGLFCNQCVDGNDKLRCRVGAIKLQASDYGRPYNKIPWLVSHNAYASSAYNIFPTIFQNQDLTITEQLNRGVRGLMLDVYLINENVFLCHDMCKFGQLLLQTVLTEIKSWLAANPTEILTLFFEDYVASTAPGKLYSEFQAAGLAADVINRNFMRTDGSDWLSVRELLAKGRLVVMSDSKKGDFPYQWDYYVESWYGDQGLPTNDCTVRDSGSQQLSNKNVGMVLVNYFPSIGNDIKTCAVNTKVNYEAKLATCYKAGGNRLANYIAVDFFEHHNDGGVFTTFDYLFAKWRDAFP